MIHFSLFAVPNKSTEYIVVRISRLLVDRSVCTSVHFAFYRTVSPHRTRAWRIPSIFTRACVGTSHSCRTPVKRPENGRNSYVNGLHDSTTCDSYMATRRLHRLTLTRFRTSHTVAVDKQTDDFTHTKLSREERMKNIRENNFIYYYVSWLYSHNSSSLADPRCDLRGSHFFTSSVLRVWKTRVCYSCYNILL